MTRSPAAARAAGTRDGGIEGRLAVKCPLMARVSVAEPG